MAYNSDARTISATTTETEILLPTRTSAISITAPNTNTDFVLVRLGGGAPIRFNAGDVKDFDIENVCLGYFIQGLEPPPQIFFTTISTDANSGTQTIILTLQEWRVA